MKTKCKHHWVEVGIPTVSGKTVKFRRCGLCWRWDRKSKGKWRVVEMPKVDHTK